MGKRCKSTKYNKNKITEEKCTFYRLILQPISIPLQWIFLALLSLAVNTCEKKPTCTLFKIVSTVKPNHHWLDLGVEKKNGNMITPVNTVENKEELIYIYIIYYVTLKIVKFWIRYTCM